tara:strand:+ start:60 stop:1226 length:1167 start_codon:yes stop_codon:yes gene_type:complete
MNQPKYQKFNTGKTKDYFPLLRWRFNTVNHPVIQSSERCASSTAKSKFSIQELQMLVGLTNTLQCNEREAVRIALYEAARRRVKAHSAAFKSASSQSTEKGHQGRSSLKQWKLPKAERQIAFEAAKELGISDSEFIRMAVIWLQRGIRNGSIDALTNSKLIPFDAVARTWSRENPGSKAQGRVPHQGVAKLKQAAKTAYEEAGYINKQRNKAKWVRRKNYLMENGFELPLEDDGSFDKLESLDALVEIQEAESFERIIQEQIATLRLGEREAFNFRWLEQIPALTKKELDWLWEDQLAEAKEQAQFEEQINGIERDLEAFINELNLLMTPEEIKCREQRQRELDNLFNRKYAWAVPAMKHREQLLSDPDLVFKKWLERSLDDLFNARA